MSDYPEHLPLPCEVIVHERAKPAIPFGFGKGSGLNWKAYEAERRVRSQSTIEWARRMRGES